jgi:hypothetical protein
MRSGDITPGITRREALTEASNLAHDIAALSGRVHADVRLPAIEIIQYAPPTAKGMIQRPPRDVQKARKRGGARCDVSHQLNCEQPRAVRKQQVSHVSQILLEATERPASPAGKH